MTRPLHKIKNCLFTIYQAVFDAALRDEQPPEFTRLLLSFVQGQGDAITPFVKPMEAGAMLMTLPQLTQAINTDLIVNDATLARLAAACTQRMAERAEFEARKRESSMPSAPQGQQGRLQLR